MKRVLALLGIGLAAHCGGQTSESGTGSETNWVGGCTTSADCERGECLCGLCATPCGADDPCLETGFCAENGTPVFRTVCGDAAEVSGLCLWRCGAGARCSGAARCEDGVCVPEPEQAPSGAPVGAACLPQDFDRAKFGGFDLGELLVDDYTAACASNVCIADNFEGHVGCPYGQSDPEHPECFTSSGEPVAVPVEPQLVSRPPEDAMYCSCRCDGPDDGPFCTCPEGTECREFVLPLGEGSPELVGSYCVNPGTYVYDDPSVLGDARCDAELRNCEGR